MKYLKKLNFNDLHFDEEFNDDIIIYVHFNSIDFDIVKLIDKGGHYYNEQSNRNFNNKIIINKLINTKRHYIIDNNYDIFFMFINKKETKIIINEYIDNIINIYNNYINLYITNYLSSIKKERKILNRRKYYLDKIDLNNLLYEELFNNTDIKYYAVKLKKSTMTVDVINLYSMVVNNKNNLYYIDDINNRRTYLSTISDYSKIKIIKTYNTNYIVFTNKSNKEDLIKKTKSLIRGLKISLSYDMKYIKDIVLKYKTKISSNRKILSYLLNSKEDLYEKIINKIN